MRITLPDGNTKEFPGPVTGREIAASIGERLAAATIGVKIDGELIDADRPIDHDAVVTLITTPRKNTPIGEQSPEALYLLRHSCAHVMAEAIQRIWPDALLAYGPPLDNGFYYDIALDTPISADDFERIEAEMKKIVEEDRPFTRYELSPEPGMSKLEAEGNKYKLDNAQRALDGDAEALSWYVTGEVDESAIQNPQSEIDNWEDLCMGPHLPRTGLIGAFKVMSVAQSHWHGDITSDRFQRVYGTAFFSQKDLDAYLEQLEEAKQRDHRVLGKKLKLFHIDEMVGQGLVLWTPNGAVVRQVLQDFIMRHLQRQGYAQVFTPHIGKLELYKTSGHFPYYQDSQYPPLVERETLGAMAKDGCSCGDLANRMRDGEIDGYLLKPMNCPHHIKIYASQPRSYRDLPIRLAEFGTVYRWEQSGEIGGMTRVRGFTQDDAHLFVTEEQLGDELNGCLELVKIVFNTLGMDDYRVRVGLRDPDDSKYVGKPENWDKAEAACGLAAESLGVPFTKEPGEAAFYGPKIDFVTKDVIGRDWQLGTVQVDYNLPERFDLSYIGADNQAHRPIMIHRAPFGSMERFIGCLIEHFAGAFPLWLAPQQVRVLPISDKFADYARRVHGALTQAGFRAAVDLGADRVQAKIKVAQEDQVPYMLVVGGKDELAGTVSVRDRRRGDLGAMPLEAFVEQAIAERDNHGATQVDV